ncbi:MAG: hypothetical protein HFI70_14200 [Lachnospiraceae bacterium]|nr:hypothetical protein [Lachnospiraceae bacterium]
MNEKAAEFCQTMILENKEDAGRNIREEVFRQIREREKTQRQDEYEDKVKETVKELSRLITLKEWTEAQGTVEKILEPIQNMAFMEGYMYAIAVLEEGLVNMKG